MSGRTRLVSNTAWNFAGLLLPLAVGVLTLPLLIRLVGLERFGFISLVWVLVGYASIFDFGIGRALIRTVAAHLAAKDTPRAAASAHAALLFLTLFGVLLALLLAPASAWLVRSALNLPAELVPEAVPATVLLAASLPFVMLTTGFGGLLSAHQRFKALNVIRIVMGVAGYLGPVLVALWSKRLDAVVAVVLALRVLGTLLHAIVCAQQCAWRPRLALPTADEHGVPIDAIDSDRDEAHILGEHVDAIVPGWCNGDLELSGEVGVTVDRLDTDTGPDERARCGIAEGDGLFAVEPDLDVGRGARTEVVGEQRSDTGMGVRGSTGERRRAGAHVAHDIATCGERGEQFAVDGLDEVTQPRLRDCVVLDALSGGESHGAVSDLVAHPVEGGPLRGRHHAPGDGNADHAGIGELLALGGECLSTVPVVLLVEPVELDQVGAVGRERGGGIVQFGDQRASEVVAAGLGSLNRGADTRTRDRQCCSICGRDDCVRPGHGPNATRKPDYPYRELVSGRHVDRFPGQTRSGWETAAVQVSARAEYAVRAVVELARLPAHRAISAERVAMQADVPGKFLEAILTDLRHAGLVVTQRGAQGGCRLARPADQITVSEVFSAVEGVPGQVRGLAPSEVVYPAGNDAVRLLWMGVQASVLRVLSGVTLAQLADDRLPPAISRLAAD